MQLDKTQTDFIVCGLYFNKAVNKNKAENSPKFGRGINLQTEEHEQTPKRINANKSMPRHIIVKLLKGKNEGKKIFKTVKNDTD